MVREDSSGKEAEHERNRRLERFDEIFKMYLTVTTITISVGSLYTEKDNLWNALIFILTSLALWMVGHALGVDAFSHNLEVWAKLQAWVLLTFVSANVSLKFALSVSSLNLILSMFCIGCASVLTYPPYRWLSGTMKDRMRRKVKRNIVATLIGFALLISLGSSLL